MSAGKLRKVFVLLTKTAREFFVMWKVFGFRYAFYGLAWWLCFYGALPFRAKISRWALNGKTDWLDDYVGRKYADVLAEFNDCGQDTEPAAQHRIWVFWGQGENAMPPLVLACYRQLVKFNGNVTLVTCQNIGDYIKLPSVVFEKVNNGIITWAHFSDIVRNALLAEYGGLWLDATVWVPGRLPLEKLDGMAFFTACGTRSAGRPAACFWTTLEWSWSGWCLWSPNGRYLLFRFVSRMLQEMALNEKATPDYVIIDYLIYYACRHFKSVRENMEKCREIPCNQRNRLALLMNEPYDAEIYRRLTKEDFVFKLSYRADWKSRTRDGRCTFYGKLISDTVFPGRE